ncbi:MAG: hypothetical protein V4449_00740 [Patescibacteria group bacterium]
METDVNKAEDTAGNRTPEKEPLLDAPTKSADSPNTDHPELLPVIAPVLLDGPEKNTEKPAPVVPNKVVLPLGALELKRKFGLEEPLTKAQNSLHIGNAITEAQNIASTLPGKKELAKDAPELVRSIPPAERSEREIGIGEQPIREKTPPPEIESIKHTEDGGDGIPRVRTYANDISMEIRKRNTTLTAIVGAEQQRTMTEGPYEDEAAIGRRKNRGRMFLVGALFLIVIGIGSVGVAFFLHTSSEINPPRQSLIPANHALSVEHTSEEVLSTELAKIKESAVINLGEVEEFVIASNGSELNASEILTLLGSPNELSRNATGIMVGIHAFDHNQPFLLVTVSAYDRAFEAMLSWETRMNEGLGDFFRPSSLAPASITSTPPALTFTDRTIQNIDIRESQVSWHIMYTFLRPDLILITTNESTLREIITRLSLQKTSN